MDGLHPPVRTCVYYFLPGKWVSTCLLFSKLDESTHPLTELYPFSPLSLAEWHTCSIPVLRRQRGRCIFVSSRWAPRQQKLHSETLSQFVSFLLQFYFIFIYVCVSICPRMRAHGGQKKVLRDNWLFFFLSLAKHNVSLCWGNLFVLIALRPPMESDLGSEDRVHVQLAGVDRRVPWWTQ